MQRCAMYVWLLFVKHLIGGTPVMAMHRCTIVLMGCMGGGEFPPTIRNAGIMPHSFWFVHNSMHEAFSVTVLLWCVGCTLENVNPLLLEHVIKCFGLVLSPSIRHSSKYFAIILDCNHVQEETSCSKCIIFGMNAANPSHGWEIIEESDDVPMTVIWLSGKGF